MPLITPSAIAAGAFAEDAWRRIAPESPLADDVLVDAGRLAEALASGRRFGLDLPNDVDFALLSADFDRIALIAVAFPSFADGRGFSIGRRLRDLGFAGVLRAAGKLIPDQYAYARRTGFDEIEISDDQAARQPIGHWAAAADRPAWFQRRGRAAA